ncbi:MAG: hypothetical protein IKU34_02185 [Clostridia bacterium]|nr:hypothetical protein [Clostridia bacterium]
MTTLVYHAGSMTALILAVMGYGALYRRSRLPVCFFPLTLVSGISVVLYGFGFAGQLRIGCYAILLCGIVLLALCRKGFHPISFFSDPSIVFCLFAGLWLFAITRDVFLSHWDDGSHWYRICKSMYAEGAFPTTPDILYHNYVPGCQLWVYFVLRFVQFSQANCMFSQGLINIACVAALFAGMRQAKTRFEKAAAIVLIALASVTLCSMSMGTYGLLVDLQLGLAAMALLILLLDQGENSGALLPAAMVFAFLLLIKNSAVFFAVMIFAWAAFSHRWRGKLLFGNGVLMLLLPMALRFAYSVRAGIVYSEAVASPQSFSLSRFADMFALKDMQVLRTFLGRFSYKVLIGDTGLSAAVYVSAALLGLVYVCLRMEKKREAEKVGKNLLFGLVMQLLYIALLLVMYLFAMNTNEMLSVNSFYRYYGSMVAVFAGMAVYTAMSMLLSCSIAPNGTMRVCVMGMLIFAVLAIPGAYSKRYILGRERFAMPDHYGQSFWRTMEYHIPQNKQYSGERYVVFWDRNEYSDSALINMGVEYNIGAWMRSEKVIAIERAQLHSGLSAEQEEALASCDHVVFMSDMTQERELIAPYISVSDLTIGLKSKE